MGNSLLLRLYQNTLGEESWNFTFGLSVLLKVGYIKIALIVKTKRRPLLPSSLCIMLKIISDQKSQSLAGVRQ